MQDIAVAADVGMVADRFQPGLEARFLLLGQRMLLLYAVGHAVSVLIFRFSLAAGRFSRLPGRDLTSHHAGVGALQEDHEALPAGVDHAGFLKYRKQFGRICKDLISMIEHLLEDLFKIGLLGREFVPFFGNAACDRQDRTFLRLHDRLVGRLDRLDACFGDRRRVNGLLGLQDFAETAQQLRGDDAAVAARTAQGTERNCLGRRRHVRDLRTGNLFYGTGQRQGHVGARVAVRYRKDVQIIDPGLVRLQIVGSGDEHPGKHLDINALCCHFVLPQNLIDQAHALNIDIDFIHRNAGKGFDFVPNVLDQVFRHR